MAQKDDLFETNKNDNTKRLMLSAICVLLLVVIAFCVYLLFFYNKGDFDESSATDDSSFVPVIVASNVPDNSLVEPSSDVSEEYSLPESQEESTISHESSVPPVTSEDPVEESSEISEPPVSAELDHQWYGYVYRYLEHAIEDFTPSSASKQAYIDAINSLYSAIGGNSSFYHIVVPTQVEFLRSSFPPEVTSNSGDGFYTQSQASFVTRVIDETVVNIKNIELIPIYKEKYNDGEYLYFNSDKNYTALAAYYAYVEFCKEAGIAPVAREDLTECVIERFLGSFYTSTGSSTLENNADRVVFYDLDAKFPSDVTIYNGTSVYNKQKMIYKEVSSVANGYNAFFGREAYRIEIAVKEPSTDKSILVIGDLAAAPFVPYLSANYKTITFINATRYNDKYYVSLKEFLKDKNYDDILVIDYSTSYKSPFFFSANITAMLED